MTAYTPHPGQPLGDDASRENKTHEHDNNEDYFDDLFTERGNYIGHDAGDPNDEWYEPDSTASWLGDLID